VLTFSDDAPESAPRKLFLKVSRPDSPVGSNRQEFDFYTRVAGAMEDPPSVCCYDASCSDATGQYHLLLEDVSDTHFPGRESGLLSDVHYDLVAECLADFHAFWWQHRKLRKEFGEPSMAASVDEYVNSMAERLPRFLEPARDELSAKQQAWFERGIPSLRRLWKGRIEGKGTTLIHGDAHFGNFLFPREAAEHRVYMVDWQFWNSNLGANDLAFMMALDWPAECRRTHEERVLERYHARLKQRGVRDYDFDALRHDYRVSVIHNLFTPMWMCPDGPSPDIWKGDLKNILQAFEDLGCEELLGD